MIRVQSEKRPRHKRTSKKVVAFLEVKFRSVSLTFEGRRPYKKSLCNLAHAWHDHIILDSQLGRGQIVQLPPNNHVSNLRWTTTTLVMGEPVL